MFISLGFYRRKPGLNWKEFSSHWRDVHGRLLRETPEVSHYLVRYVQHHVRPLTGFGDVQALGFDGFSEAWFESAEHRRRMWDEPVFKRLIVPDEANFLDLSATRVAMMDHPTVQVAGDPAVLLAFAANPGANHA